ncbi:MAG: hypothetical protein JNJ85_03825 [Candidatus Kapabacteria bacterium]|nr:hypothetical protein [Candidatus Kapabacteria bacterium]
MKLLIAVILITITYTGVAQTGTTLNTTAKNTRTTDETVIRKNILSQATTMLKALKSKDYTTFLTFQHPDVIKAVGGDTSFLRFIKEQMAKLNNTQIVIMEPATIRQVLRIGTTWQCVIDQITEMRMDSTTIISSVVPLIGFSDDGTTWKFIDASNGAEKVKSVIPSLSNLLYIPYKKNQFGVDVQSLYKDYTPEYPETTPAPSTPTQSKKKK